jgi:RNA polymerase sigma factor (sigma-70 family)
MMKSAELPHFRKFFDDLVGLAVKRGLPHDDAEDLVASAIESVIRNFIPEKGRFQAYCTTAVANRVKNYWRDRKPACNGDEMNELPDPEWARQFFTRGEESEMIQKIAEIRMMLDECEQAFLDHLRAVFEELDNRAVSEAARRMGISPAQGWDLLRRIRRKVQRATTPAAARMPAMHVAEKSTVLNNALEAIRRYRSAMHVSCFERIVRRTPKNLLLELESFLSGS